MAANESQYRIEITGVPADSLTILSYKGREGISRLFQYEVSCISWDVLEYDDLVGQTATLVIFDEGGEDILHHGIITGYTEGAISGKDVQNREQVYIHYNITVEPTVLKLAYTRQSRVFQNMSYPDIIESIFDENGYTNYRLELDSYAQREYVVQYNESDLDFIKRLMEYEGIFYFFDHTGSEDVMVIADSNSAFQPILNGSELEFNPQAGMVELDTRSAYQLVKTKKAVTAAVTLKDYNYETPESNVLGSADGEGFGEYYSYSDNVATTDEATRLATLRLELLNVEKEVLQGKSNVDSLKSGYSFDVVNPSSESMVGEYIVIEAHVQGSQEGSILGTRESNSSSTVFRAIPSNTPFRPQLITPKPKVSGFMTVKTDGPEGNYSFLDEGGRYHAKLPFDLSELGDGTASLPIRMSQPYSGPDYGMHFPVHKGTDLIVAFEGGDIDRPLAIGTAPNPTMTSPVNSNNNTESVVRTASGHEFKMDDLEDETLINLKTAGNHNVKMFDKEDEKVIEIQTTDTHKILMDDTNDIIQVETKEGKNTMKMDNANQFVSIVTETGHTLKMDDANCVVGIQTSVGHKVNLDDDAGLITIQDASGDHTIQIDESGLISIQTTGDIAMQADGNIDMEAEEINMHGKSGVNIKSSRGDVSTEGMNINTKSSQGDVKIEAAMNANVKGGMNLKMEGGMNVESKAGIQSKTTGTMVNVEASAVNTIKGATVMIN